MRDILIMAAVFGTLPFAFFRPWIGILLWVWISLMNPHRLTWGMAYGFPFAQIAAVTTMAGWLFASDRGKFLGERETWLIIALGALFTVTTLTAMNPDEAWPKWERVMKILVMTVLPLFLLQRRERLRALLFTMAISIGFFSVKGGIFAIMTGGQYIVFGPPQSFISDNNALALAELMVLPLMIHLGRTEPRRWLRRGLYVAAFLTLISVVFSYSRGALLGLGAVLAIYVTVGRKWSYGVLALILAAVSVTVIPDKWFDRMGTIGTYEQDNSALGRINAWHFAFNIATMRPFVGGGFRVFDSELFQRYAPNPYAVYDAHSIYFEVLGEHGFVGLALFLALLWSCFASLSTVSRWSRSDPSLSWASEYVLMLRSCFAAYVIGGAFLGLAYFDLFYYLVVAIIILKVLVRREWVALARNRASPGAAPA